MSWQVWWLQWLSLIMLSTLWLTAQSEEEVAVPLTEIGQVRAYEGKMITGQGKLERWEVSGRSGHWKGFINGSEVVIFIHQRDTKAFTEEQRQSWVGQDIVIVGDVTQYRSQWQIVVKSPEQIARSVAELAERRAAKKKAEAEVRATQFIELTQAVLDGPSVSLQQFEGSFDQIRTSRPPTTPLVLEPPVMEREARAYPVAAINALVRWVDPWPAGQILRVRRLDSIEASSVPRGMTTALLGVALTKKQPLPRQLVVLGDITVAGTFAGGVDEITLLHTAELGPERRVIIPRSSEGALGDLLLDQKWDALATAPIFAIHDLTEAANLCEKLTSGQLEESLAQYDIVRAALAQDPRAEVLNQSHIRTALDQLATACPELVVARILADAAKAKLPDKYSAPGTMRRLRDFYLPLRVEALKVRTSPDKARKPLRQLDAQWEKLAPRAHPDWQRFTNVIDKLIRLSKTVIARSDDKTTVRYKKAIAEHKAALDLCDAELQEVKRLR